MVVLLITYDLNKKDKDYDGILDLIKSYSYAQLSKSAYVIDTNETLSKVYEKLEKHIDENDNIYVITLTSTSRKGQASSKTVDWMKEHLPQP